MEIVSRREWGAKPATSRVTTDRVTETYLHHTAGFHSGAEGMRQIQRFHQQSRGWADIAYNFVIDPDTLTVYEGRGWVVRPGSQKGHNKGTWSVCVMGNFQNEHPTQGLVETVAELIRYGAGLDHIPLVLTGGHRDAPGQSTSCPGRHLHAAIPAIRQLLATVPAEEDPMLPITANSHRETIRYVQERLGVKLTGEWDEPTVDAVKALAVRSGTNDGKGLKGEWINGRMYSALDDEGAFAQAEKALKVAKVAGGASAAVVIAEIVQRLAG